MSSLFGKGEYTFDRTVRLTLSVTVGTMIFFLLRYLSDVLLPFAIAIGLAYLLSPLIKWVESKFDHHIPAVIGTLGLVFLAFAAFLAVAIPTVTEEVKQFITIIRNMGEQSDLAKRAAQRLPPDVWDALRELLKTPEVKTWVQSTEGVETIKDFVSQVTPQFFTVLKSTGQIVYTVLGAGIILLYLVFILIDYPSLVNSAKQMVPGPLKEGINLFVVEFDQQMSRYFRAQAIVATIMGVLFSIGFSIIGLPMPWLLGLMMGALNLIPYMQLLGVPPVLFFALVNALDEGSSFKTAVLGVFIVLVVVQVLQDVFIVPKVMGDASGLSPAIMLLSLSIWGKLLGLLGLMLAIPFTCLCISWYHRWIETHDFGDDNTDPPGGDGDNTLSSSSDDQQTPPTLSSTKPS